MSDAQPAHGKPAALAPSIAAPAPRLLSVDALRGLTMAAMILVNNPGSWSHLHRWVAHAHWGEPETLADLVFPFFLFLVGVSVPLALGGRLERGASRRALLAHAARRSVRLFAIGLLLAAIPSFDLGALRLMGVLQRIALVYLGCAALYLAAGAGGRRSWSLPAVAAGAILLGYGLLLAFVPAPGHPAPGLDPAALSLEGSLPVWVDRQVLAGHLWLDGFDPEGFLSTLPALATGLLGLVAGRILRARRGAAGRLAALGAGLVLVGLAWSLAQPMEKDLWTSSYAAFTAGLACLALAALHALLDLRGGRRGWLAPLLAYGSNSLLAFVAAHLGAKLMVYGLRFEVAGKTISAHSWIYRHLFLPWLGPADASLAFSVALVLFWLVPLAILRRRGIVVRL